jgi:hypothetical protein
VIVADDFLVAPAAPDWELFLVSNRYPRLVSPGVLVISHESIGNSNTDGCRRPAAEWAGIEDGFSEIEIVNMGWPQSSVWVYLRGGAYQFQIKCWDGDPWTEEGIPEFQTTNTLTVVGGSLENQQVQQPTVSMDTRGVKLRAAQRMQQDGRNLVVVTLGAVEVYRGYDTNPPPAGPPGFALETCGSGTPWAGHFRAGAGLAAAAGPVVGGEVTLSGTRPVDATITVSCPTATVGAVSYPTATTWEVTAEILGTGTFTVSDGTDTVYVEVSGDILGASAVAASLGVVASSSDAYYLARNYAVGLSQLAGSWAYIDWPQGAFGQRARFGVAPSSAFAAAWADATAQAHAMGFASLSAFAAFWANAHAEAASFGFDAVSDYAIADKDNRADGTVFGFESGAAFSAAWASAQSVAARLGFSSVSAFVAVWEEAATTAARFGLDCTAVWYSEDSGVATVGGIFGVRASAFYTPRGWDGTPTKVDLFDRSTRMVLTGRNATTALGDRSTRVLLTERSDD